MAGGVLRNYLSSNEQDEHPAEACFAFAVQYTLCTGTVRIIAPSPNKGESGFWGLLDKLEFVILLIYIYAFYIKKCYFSSATVRNQRNIVIVGGSNHEISLS